MALTASDVVEGRIGIALLLGFLAFGVIANVIVQPPASIPAAMLALGGAVAILLQNTLTYISQWAEERRSETPADAA